MPDDVVYFANEDDMQLELSKYGPDGRNILTPETMIRGMKRGNQMVYRKLINIEIPTDPIPDEVVEAATLYSVAKILDILWQEQDARSPTAVQNDKDADAILQGYIDEQPQEASGIEITMFGVDGTLVDAARKPKDPTYGEDVDYDW